MKTACSREAATRRAIWTGVLATLPLAGCVTTDPQGGAAKGAVTGAAGGATAAGEQATLEHCDESLGALSVVEDQSATWFQTLAQYKLGSTIPMLRLMIQQSNCFVVVERGAAMQNMQAERALMQTGEMRVNSNFGQGQMVAADYTMNPTIQFSQNTSGASAGIGGLIGGSKGKALGMLLGGIKTNESSTTLILIDNRSGVQLAAAEGSAKKSDFDIGAALFGSLGGAMGGGYTKSPQGKIILAAFTDSYNQMVRAVRNYKAQTVAGGLGTGGTLAVQGGVTATPLEMEAPAAGVKPVPTVK